MAKLKWYLQRWVEILGWSGSVGVVLLVLILIIGLATLMPAQNKLQALDEQVKTAAEKTRVLPKSSITNQASAVDRFKTQFPKWGDMPQTLTKVYEIAKTEEVSLEQGEGLVTMETSRDLLRYELTFPIAAGYVQVRNFMAKLMQDIPTASVDEVTFKRESINNPRVSAEIRLTLYFRDA